MATAIKVIVEIPDTVLQTLGKTVDKNLRNMVTDEINRAVADGLTEAVANQLGEALRSAIAGIRPTPTGLYAFAPSQTLDALKAVYEQTSAQTHTGITFDEFDKYLGFALKCISMLAVVVGTSLSVFHYRVLWDVVRGKYNRARNPAEYQRALEGIQRMNTLGQDAFEGIARGMERMNKQMSDNMLELLSAAGANKKTTA